MNKQKTLIFSLLAMLFLATFFIVYSWTEPTAMPAAYNAPVNTSSVAQTKLGELGATMFRDAVAPDYYIDPSGNSILFGNVSAADPIASSHLTTKGYVDAKIAEIYETISNVSGETFTLTGTNPVCPPSSSMVMKHWMPKTCSGTYHGACEVPHLSIYNTCTTATMWSFDAPSCDYYNFYSSLCNHGLVCTASSWDKILCAVE